LVGFYFMPTHLLSIVMGVTAVPAGLVLLFSSPIVGIALIIIGPVLVVVGVRIRRRQEHEENEEGEAVAQRVTGTMTPYIPKDE
ncbi:MAG: hypothetical protein JSU63_03515, partial [Phycisphaerales bacterium]